MIVVIAEIVGGAALIVGVATRWAALALTVEMVVTTLLVKLPNLGLVAAPDRPGVGAEIDLMLLAAMLVLLTPGPGALALDRAVLRREL